MLDIQLLRNNPDEVAKRLATRGFTFDVAAFQRVEAERKDIQTRTQELQARRNAASKQIGAALASLERGLAQVQERLRDMVMAMPNLPHPSVPPGRSDADNVEVRRWG